MVKRMFGSLFFLLFSVALAHQATADVTATTQSTMHVEGFEIAIPEFRDYDFKQFDCYGCPDDPSMTDGIVERVKAQKEDYQNAHEAYQASWDVKDVLACSSLAFTTQQAAYPWNNLAFHMIQNDGDMTLAEKYLNVAKVILGTKGSHLLNADGEDIVEKNLTYVHGVLNSIEKAKKKEKKKKIAKVEVEEMHHN